MPKVNWMHVIIALILGALIYHYLLRSRISPKSGGAGR